MKYWLTSKNEKNFRKTITIIVYTTQKKLKDNGHKILFTIPY